ncbi:hypothetical protein [Thiohalophilus thiocyanatoxydans]|uniref:Lipoprotein n=1 Tax=Thiohalophilus thiocyanatoxydans TaxID=381308 RepID=A0A4R8IRF0_9GAMM|nr:hypothetical protein [Thiohalophilus thiocyanatoxydans]TDY02914.1 hypothetical protein EDC23_1298 [Thiohalophilus thiocyanatoxydans]
MKFSKWMMTGLLVAITVLAGCRSNPVMNVDEAAISLQNEPEMQQVEKAIIRAGSTLGWNMKKTAPGKMEGRLMIRSHVAVVDITYDTKSYSIRYKDSENLDYDGTNIHSNYNGWVQNLDRNIQQQLMTL